MAGRHSKELMESVPPGHEIADEDWAVIERMGIQPRQLVAFTLVGQGVDPKEAARSVGVSFRALQRWMTTSWWDKLYRMWLEPHMHDFHMELVKRKETFITAMEEIASGQRSDDKSANAAIRAVEIFSRMAPAGMTPLINSSSHVNISNNTQVNNFNGGLDRDKLLELARRDPSAILEMQKSGVPPEYRVVEEGAK